MSMIRKGSRRATFHKNILHRKFKLLEFDLDQYKWFDSLIFISLIC